MMQRTWHRPGISHLRVTSQPQRKKLMILAAAVGLAILAVVATALVLRFRPSGSATWTYHFQCQNPNCRSEFDQAQQNPPERAQKVVDCPQCRQKDAAVMMRKCPRCRRWFLPPKEGPVICSHSDCGINVDEARLKE